MKDSSANSDKSDDGGGSVDTCMTDVVKGDEEEEQEHKEKNQEQESKSKTKRTSHRTGTRSSEAAKKRTKLNRSSSSSASQLTSQTKSSSQLASAQKQTKSNSSSASPSKLLPSAQSKDSNTSTSISATSTGAVAQAKNKISNRSTSKSVKTSAGKLASLARVASMQGREVEQSDSQSSALNLWVHKDCPRFPIVGEYFNVHVWLLNPQRQLVRGMLVPLRISLVKRLGDGSFVHVTKPFGKGVGVYSGSTIEPTVSDDAQANEFDNDTGLVVATPTVDFWQKEGTIVRLPCVDSTGQAKLSIKVCMPADVQQDKLHLYIEAVEMEPVGEDEQDNGKPKQQSSPATQPTPLCSVLTGLFSVVHCRLQSQQALPDEWLRDPGGKSNVLSLVIQMQGPYGAVFTGWALPIRVVLCYESGEVVQNQKLLEISVPRVVKSSNPGEYMHEPIHIYNGEEILNIDPLTGECEVGCRILEVSKRHNSQRFMLKVEPCNSNATTATGGKLTTHTAALMASRNAKLPCKHSGVGVVAACWSNPVKVMSKINKHRQAMRAKKRREKKEREQMEREKRFLTLNTPDALRSEVAAEALLRTGQMKKGAGGTSKQKTGNAGMVSTRATRTPSIPNTSNSTMLADNTSLQLSPSMMVGGGGPAATSAFNRQSSMLYNTAEVGMMGLARVPTFSGMYSEFGHGLLETQQQHQQQQIRQQEAAEAVARNEIVEQEEQANHLQIWCDQVRMALQSVKDHQQQERDNTQYNTGGSVQEGYNYGSASASTSLSASYPITRDTASAVGNNNSNGSITPPNGVHTLLLASLHKLASSTNNEETDGVSAVAEERDDGLKEIKADEKRSEIVRVPVVVDGIVVGWYTPEVALKYESVQQAIESGKYANEEEVAEKHRDNEIDVVRCLNKDHARKVLLRRLRVCSTSMD